MSTDVLARDVRRIAWPAIVSSLLQTLVFVVDRVMLGHHGAASLAGMQIAGPLEWSIFSVVSAFEVGTLARVGLHVGAGRKKEARRVAVVSLAIALVSGVALALATPLVLRAVSATAPLSSPDAVREATRYLGVMLPASPVVFVSTAAIAVFQGRGDTRTPLVVGGLVNVLHVAQNRVLVLGALGVPALGALGAGLSTALSFTLQSAVLLVLLRKKLREDDPDASLFEGLRGEVRPLVRVGGPAFGERVVYHVGYLGYAGMVALLGDTAMAANQALISVESVCFLSADGFGIAAAALVAQRLGRGEPEEGARAARIATTYAVLTLTALGALSFLARGLVLPAFCDDPKVLAAGLATMPVLVLAQPFMAVGVVRAQALRGAGATGKALGVSLVGALVVRLAATWAFAYGLGLGLVGIWLGSTVDWIVRTALFAFVRLPRAKAKKPLGSDDLGAPLGEERLEPGSPAPHAEERAPVDREGRAE